MGTFLSDTWVFTPAPPPSVTVTSMKPNAVGQGGTRPVTVNGSNFVNGATVSMSGTGVTVASTKFVSSTQLTVSFSASLTAAV